jgi:hypothetical protein
MPPELREPWRSFLHDVDARLHRPVELHCLGGFVVTVLHGLPRPTADIDVLSVVPGAALGDLIELAGELSPLHRKHGVYLDIVTVVTCPDGYEGRLVECLPGTRNRLRLLALDPYDLALAKLERNLQRDRDDVLYLARVAHLDLDLLRTRYAAELRPYLGRPEREDLTLNLWIELIQESRGL